MKKKTQENNTHKKIQEVSLFPAGDHKAARIRQDSITKTTIANNKRSTTFERSLKYYTGKLNMFNGINLTLNSDVDQDT